METRIAEQPYGTRSVITGNPEKIAAAVIRDIEVAEDMLGNYNNASLTREASGQLNFIPQELTRTLHVKLNINGVSNIRSVKCVIAEVPSSLFLHDGSPGDAGHSQEFTLGDPVLHAGSFTDGYQESTVNVFGFDKNVPHKIRIHRPVGGWKDGGGTDGHWSGDHREGGRRRDVAALHRGAGLRDHPRREARRQHGLRIRSRGGRVGRGEERGHPPVSREERR